MGDKMKKNQKKESNITNKNSNLCDKQQSKKSNISNKNNLENITNKNNNNFSNEFESDNCN